MDTCLHHETAGGKLLIGYNFTGFQPFYSYNNNCYGQSHMELLLGIEKANPS